MKRSDTAASISPTQIDFHKGTLIVLAVLFFFSGSVALVYEVLWQRQFSLVFGSAAPATAAVLAAYFAGLGTGSVFFGRLVRKLKRPLRAYAFLEALIGMGALLVTQEIRLFEGFYPAIYEFFSGNSVAFSAIKTLLGFISIGIPTFFMGGTLPIVAHLVDAGERKLSSRTGLLYAANTAGAGLGALSVPFLLLAQFGAEGSLRIAVTGNLMIGVAAWFLDRGAPSPAEPIKRTRIRTDSKSRTGMKSILSLSFFSGAVTFVLQVLWNRAFAQVHENSVYSFAVVLSTFIFALSVGAAMSRRFLRARFTPRVLLGWTWITGAFLLAIGPWLFLQITNGLSDLAAVSGWTTYALRLISMAAGVLFLPVVLLGVALPALMEQAGQVTQEEIGDVVGKLFAANVAGSVFGALVAGFVLPQWLGLWNSILLMAALTLLVGLRQLPHTVVALGSQRFFRRLVIAVTAIVVVASSAADFPRVKLSKSGEEQLLSLSEGTHGIVAVVERPGSRTIKLNNYYVLGGTGSAGDERLQAHLPLLLHPKPRKVKALGLGTGITAGGALFHPIEQLHALELVPEVVEVARSHFQRENADLFQDQRSRVIVEDARNDLRGSGNKFDVIIGDLVVPWMPGESALFTYEHFSAARKALAPGGLFCQWFPMFQLSKDEFQILLNTFVSVFPRAMVWRGDFFPNETAIALIGAEDSFQLAPKVVEQRLRQLKPDPLNLHLQEPEGLWMYFVGLIHPEDVTETRINSENRPYIEFLAPMRKANDSSSKAFTGRSLQKWFQQTRQQSYARLPELTQSALTGWTAGEILFEFAISESEGNRNRAMEARNKLQTLLPAKVFDTIFPEN